jgi:hypothetical protein
MPLPLTPLLLPPSPLACVSSQDSPSNVALPKAHLLPKAEVGAPQYSAYRPGKASPVAGNTDAENAAARVISVLSGSGVDQLELAIRSRPLET